MKAPWLRLAHSTWRCGLVAFVACVFIQDATPSQACSISPPPAAFFPNSGSVPENLPAVLWRPALDADLDAVTAADVKFVRKVGSDYEDVPFTLTRIDQHFSITADGGLIAGETYLLWSAVSGEGDGQFPSEPPLFRKDGVLAVDADKYPDRTQRAPAFAELNVTQAVDLPTSLGTLAISEPQQQPLTLPGGASCVWTTNATTAVASLNLDSPWLDVVLLEMIVDGESYSTAPALGDTFDWLSTQEWETRSSVRLDNICGDTYPLKLSSEQHTAKMVAHIPGSDVVIESESATVDLPMPDCSVMYLADGGVVEPSTSTMDAGTTRGDDMAPAAQKASGSCSAIPGRVGHGGAWMVAGLALLWRRRRSS